MINPGDRCTIKRDIAVEGVGAFTSGENVVVDKVEPDAENPEKMYVVFSPKLGRAVKLTEADLTVTQAAEAGPEAPAWRGPKEPSDEEPGAEEAAAATAQTEKTPLWKNKKVVGITLGVVGILAVVAVVLVLVLVVFKSDSATADTPQAAVEKYLEVSSTGDQKALTALIDPEDVEWMKKLGMDPEQMSNMPTDQSVKYENLKFDTKESGNTAAVKLVSGRLTATENGQTESATVAEMRSQYKQMMEQAGDAENPGGDMNVPSFKPAKDYDPLTVYLVKKNGKWYISVTTQLEKMGMTKEQMEDAYKQFSPQ